MFKASLSYKPPIPQGGSVSGLQLSLISQAAYIECVFVEPVPRPSPTVGLLCIMWHIKMTVISFYQVGSLVSFLQTKPQALSPRITEGVL